jgi:hypothetical protein
MVPLIYHTRGEHANHYITDHPRVVGLFSSIHILNTVNIIFSGNGTIDFPEFLTMTQTLNLYLLLLRKARSIMEKELVGWLARNQDTVPQ